MYKMGLKNYADLASKLRGINKLGDEIASRTVSDMKNRGPTQVSKAVREIYAISAADMKGQVDMNISKKAIGSVKVSGRTVEELAFVYQGRRLTFRHYHQNPMNAMSHAGPGKGKLVKAEIRKGRKKVIGGSVFTAPGKGGRILPFQREGIERTPLRALRSMSIPQMIQYSDGKPNPDTEPLINKYIGELLEKRLENHVASAQKKVGKVRG